MFTLRKKLNKEGFIREITAPMYTRNWWGWPFTFIVNLSWMFMGKAGYWALFPSLEHCHWPKSRDFSLPWFFFCKMWWSFPVCLLFTISTIVLINKGSQLGSGPSSRLICKAVTVRSSRETEPIKDTCVCTHTYSHTHVYLNWYIYIYNLCVYKF